MSELKKSADSTAALNLKRLLLLRSIAIICETLVLAVAIRVLHIDLPVTAMVAVIVLHIVSHCKGKSMSPCIVIRADNFDCVLLAS